MSPFKLNPDSFEVELDQEWLYLIPEFAALIKADRGSPGDYRGDKKRKAIRQFTYIYYMLSYSSPIARWTDEKEKKQEAMKASGMSEDDLENPLVVVAYAKFDEYQMKAAPELKTLRLMRDSLPEIDEYFVQVKKSGKKDYSPTLHVNNLKLPKQAYDAVDEFEERVFKKLRGSESGIRGRKSKIGGQEGKRKEGTWKEGGNPVKSKQTAGMVDLAGVITKVTSDFIGDPYDEPDEEPIGEGDE